MNEEHGLFDHEQGSGLFTKKEDFNMAKRRKAAGAKKEKQRTSAKQQLVNLKQKKEQLVAKRQLQRKDVTNVIIKLLLPLYKQFKSNRALTQGRARACVACSIYFLI